jgi:hypothetical protein
MTQLGLMNQLDVSTKFGDFNIAIIKGDPNINIDYEINPQLLAIFHRNQFAGDDIEEVPYKHLDFLQTFAGLSDLRTAPMMR